MLRMVGLLAGVLGCCAAVALASTPTKLERWTAFTNGKLAAGIHVVQTSRGSCSGGSHVDARSDAWRCRSGSELQDPCFPAGSFVVCPYGTPDSHDVLKLDLAGPLPAGKANPSVDPTRTLPWVIVTATGDYCYRATGTPIHAAGKAVTYQCAGTALLAGHPNRTQAVWRIDLLLTGTSTRYRTVAITAAWW